MSAISYFKSLEKKYTELKIVRKRLKNRYENNQ